MSIIRHPPLAQTDPTCCSSSKSERLLLQDDDWDEDAAVADAGSEDIPEVQLLEKWRASAPYRLLSVLLAALAATHACACITSRQYVFS